MLLSNNKRRPASAGIFSRSGSASYFTSTPQELIPSRSSCPAVRIVVISMAPVSGSGNEWSETAMVVIDMQKDFVDPATSSAALLAGEAVLPIVTEAVAVARHRGIFIVWVLREHDPSGRDVELFRRHFYSSGKGLGVEGSKGAELADGLTIEDGDYKLVKTRFSAFFATHLDSVLKTSGIKNLVIVGVQTPNCIRQTAFDAVALDYDKVAVIIDATAAAKPEIHLSNMIDMKNIGVETPTLEEWRR